MVLIRWDVFFLLWAGMMVFHLVTYFGSQYLEGEPHTVGGALDERIPFHPGWIYIYSSWFVLLLGVPALLNIVAPELCLKYMLAHSIDQLLSNIIYLIYPTTFERPVPPKKGLTGFVIGTVYGAFSTARRACIARCRFSSHLPRSPHPCCRCGCGW